jgi:hypothetical protein
MFKSKLNIISKPEVFCSSVVISGHNFSLYWILRIKVVQKIMRHKNPFEKYISSLVSFVYRDSFKAWVIVFEIVMKIFFLLSSLKTDPKKW